MNPFRRSQAEMALSEARNPTSMMSGAEREEAQRKQEDAARRAAAFEKQRANTELQEAEDSAGEERGSFGAEPSVSNDKSIVCTEMYRQTQLVDWQRL